LEEQTLILAVMLTVSLVKQAVRPGFVKMLDLQVNSGSRVEGYGPLVRPRPCWARLEHMPEVVGIFFLLAPRT
jgi:hypothetical protein